MITTGKMHFIPPSREGWTGCGQVNAGPRGLDFTDELEKVTCERCKGSRVFKNWERHNSGTKSGR